MAACYGVGFVLFEGEVEWIFGGGGANSEWYDVRYGIASPHPIFAHRFINVNLTKAARSPHLSFNCPGAVRCLGEMEDAMKTLTMVLAGVVAVRVRLGNHGWAFRRSIMPPMATRIMACETSMRCS